ncbi:unannotated protein [freshwater metagenome]|uniref:Unannotated protein n=1 Tax=freshwater metagenome TaxID=449393 RepID=A0A6J6B070_9ZZZZ|nr:hypothetical protein [Actinomycetota bacterium]
MAVTTYSAGLVSSSVVLDSPTWPTVVKAKISSLSERTRDFLSVLIIGVALLIPVWGLLRYQGPPMEEGFMLAFPEQILLGRLPHRDFLHLYGPGSLWFLAGVYKLFGTTIVVERLVGLLQHGAVAFGMFALLKPFGRRIATASALVALVILIGPGGLSAMAWNGALGLAVCSLALGAAACKEDSSHPKVLAAIAGVLAGAALLFRPDLFIAVGLGSLAMMFRMAKPQRLPLVLGGLATVALYIPHVVLSGLGASFEGMFLEPVFKLRAGRALPVPPTWDRADGFLQRAGALRPSGWPLPMPEISQQIFLWFFLVPASILLVLFAAWRLRKQEPDSSRTTALWPAALFCAALITQAVQRPDSTHLSWVTGISFALCIPAIAVLVQQARPSWAVSRSAWLGTACIGAILVAVIPFYPLRTYVDLAGQSFGRNTFGYEITRDGRSFYIGNAEGATDAQQITDQLSRLSQPGESLIVGPTDLSRTNYNDAFFYYLFPELPPGTRYIEMDPGLADASDSGLAEELLNNDWLILSDVWSDWSEPNTSSGSGSPVPNQVVKDHYCKVTEANMFSLYRRCR